MLLLCELSEVQCPRVLLSYHPARLKDAWPDGEARDEQKADNNQGREEVAQPLRPQKNPRVVPVLVKSIFSANLKNKQTNKQTGDPGEEHKPLPPPATCELVYLKCT